MQSVLYRVPCAALHLHTRCTCLRNLQFQHSKVSTFLGEKRGDFFSPCSFSASRSLSSLCPMYPICLLPFLSFPFPRFSVPCLLFIHSLCRFVWGIAQIFSAIRHLFHHMVPTKFQHAGMSVQSLGAQNRQQPDLGHILI